MKRSKQRLVPPLLQNGEKTKRRQAQHKRPKAHEKKVAGALGGRKIGGSGSHPSAKGDARREDRSFPLLVECKRSMGKMSIRLEARWLTKITAEAMGQNMYPAIALQFDKEVMDRVAKKSAPRGTPVVPASTDWIAVPLSTFRAMLEALGEEGLGL